MEEAIYVRVTLLEDPTSEGTAAAALEHTPGLSKAAVAAILTSAATALMEEE